MQHWEIKNMFEMATINGIINHIKAESKRQQQHHGASVMTWAPAVAIAMDWLWQGDKKLHRTKAKQQRSNLQHCSCWAMTMMINSKTTWNDKDSKEQLWTRCRGIWSNKVLWHLCVWWEAASGCSCGYWWWYGHDIIGCSEGCQHLASAMLIWSRLAS